MRALLSFVFFGTFLNAQSKSSPAPKNESHQQDASIEKIEAPSSYGALVVENHKKLPESIEGLAMTKTFEEGATTITLKGNKKLPVWTPVSVSGEGMEFSVLYNHFTQSWWGPGGGNEAFAEKFWRGIYTAEEAKQKCAELAPKGKWRLPDAIELMVLFDHQVEQQWGSLSPENKVIVAGQNRVDSSLLYFIPNVQDEKGNSGAKAGAIESVEKEKSERKYKFKCTLGTD